ncbi:MAG: protein-ADP-ribose hydrolase [Bilifractor sp.]
MNQKERITYLIQYLEREMPEYAGSGVPEDAKDAFDLFRALCNVRMPGPASEEFLKVQDAVLQEKTREKGITDVKDLEPVSSDARLVLWQGDISTLRCDAIVNAANSQMLGCFQPLHNCIDNVENTYAGVQLRNFMNAQMEKKRKEYGEGYEQPTAIPMISPAFNLPAEYIVHVVGPIVYPSLREEHRDQLAACYRNSLDLAAEHGCRNIAFCCISTGVFMFPQDKAAKIAVKTVKEWLDAHPGSCLKKVIFNVFKDSDLRIYQKLLVASDSRGFKRL